MQTKPVEIREFLSTHEHLHSALFSLLVQIVRGDIKRRWAHWTEKTKNKMLIGMPIRILVGTPISICYKDVCKGFLRERERERRMGMPIWISLHKEV